MENIDITIIGAGVIGLAVAARTANSRRSVAVLERHSRCGQEISSRNSEVIHSGIYYPPGSLKARLCVAGNPLLYAYCEQAAVSHARLEKIIIATTPPEVRQLEELYHNGRENQVPGLTLLDQSEVNTLEPEIQCLAGLYSPSTGIIDTHALMHKLSLAAEAQGALITYDSEISGLEKTDSGFKITLKKEGFKFKSRVVINCAGLASDYVAELAGINPQKAGYGLHYCKGDYFRTSKTLKVERLIYPVPTLQGRSLGIHLTRDLGGGIRFGPDAYYVTGPDYTVDENKKTSFCDAVRRYLPRLRPEDLYPDTSGIRPKLQGPDDGFRDFVIRHEADRGLEGLINLIGIESPGLTCCLSIADMVEDLVREIEVGA